MPASHDPHSALAVAPVPILRIWGPFAFGYFLSYLFRVVNAGIAPHLRHDLGLTAGDLGLLTGVYFIAFAAAQLPLGLALDRFGARRCEAVLLLLAVAGAVLFAMAHGFAGLVVARALIGFGVAACLMAAFKAYAVWIPIARLPLINGWQMAAGGLGAVAATTPVVAAVGLIGWRGVFVVLAGLTAVAALLIWRIIPDEPAPPPDRPPATLAAMAAGTRRVFASPLFWRVAPMAVSIQASFLAMQGLWLGPWLAHVEGLAPPAVASRLLIVAVAMVAGYIGLGWLGARTSHRGMGPLGVTFTAGLVFAAVQAAMLAGLARPLAPFLAAFGFFGTAGIVAYAGLTQRFPPALAGRVNTAINLLVFVAAFALQWGAGAIIGQWPATADGRFAAEGYRLAFALMLAGQGLSLLWFALYRPRSPSAD